MSEPATIPATIASIRLARGDVAIVTLQASLDFDWIAGQYLQLGADGFAPRFYSIANAHLHGAGPEIHVRRSGAGGLTDHLVDAARVGDAVVIHGPYGEAVLPENDFRPILLIAAGVGIAPMKAVLDYALALDQGPPVTLVWGTNQASDQYLAADFERLAEDDVQFRFLPVTGVPVSAAAAGFVREYLNARVFIAGPPEMVRATRALLEKTGFAPGMIHHDPIPDAKPPMAQPA